MADEQVSASPAGTRARPRVRWGLPDVVLAVVGGIVLSVIVAGVVASARNVPSGHISKDVPTVLASVVGQAVGVIVVLALVSWRKGQRSLRRDFGLTLRLGDSVWLLAGVGLQLGVALPIALLSDVYGHVEHQGVVQSFEQAGGFELALFAVAAVTVAPLAEELLFRGALLRALMRRTSPAIAVFASALVFALVHPAFDPRVGSLIAVPALLLLGLVSAGLAVRTRDLSCSLYLHAGFNLLTAILVVTRH
jgi:membrane protease YdiL (CAAX protease family)